MHEADFQDVINGARELATIELLRICYRPDFFVVHASGIAIHTTLNN